MVKGFLKNINIDYIPSRWVLWAGLLFFITSGVIYSQCATSIQSFVQSTSPGALITEGEDNTLYSTITTNGLSGKIVSLSVYTAISHSYTEDLNITLMSPQGNSILLSHHNGGNATDSYINVWWSDKNLIPASDFPYQNAAPTQLVPQAPFAPLQGQDPNGSWVLIINDNVGGDDGILQSWSLKIDYAQEFSEIKEGSFVYDNVMQSIPEESLQTYPLLISGKNSSIANLNLFTKINHSFSADLDLALTSPLGTTVIITTDNGGNYDNLFGHTTWSDFSGNLVTTYSFETDGYVTSLNPEGSLAAFNGENPNGYWTLSVNDDFAGQTGYLDKWGLKINTCAEPSCAEEEIAPVAGPSHLCNGDTARIHFTAGCLQGLAISSLSGLLDANSPVFHITEGEPPFCEFSSTIMMPYKAFHLQPKATLPFQFVWMEAGEDVLQSGYMALYNENFDPYNPCEGRLAYAYTQMGVAPQLEMNMLADHDYYLVVSSLDDNIGQFDIEINNSGMGSIILPDLPAVNSFSLYWEINGSVQPVIHKTCGDFELEVPLVHNGYHVCSPEHKLIHYQLVCYASGDVISAGSKSFIVYPDLPEAQDMVSISYINGHTVPTIHPLSDCQSFTQIEVLQAALPGTLGEAVFNITYQAPGLPTDCCGESCAKIMSVSYDASMAAEIPTAGEWGLLCLALCILICLCISLLEPSMRYKEAS